MGALPISRCLALGNIESRKEPCPAWLFQVDRLGWILHCGNKIFGFKAPRYRTDEYDTNLLLKPTLPPITGYRLLVTFCALGFGISKAVLSYKGFATEPTSVDWIFGCTVTVM
jgi:hypothetical protein